jgi:putative ABC transport system permease protein
VVAVGLNALALGLAEATRFLPSLGYAVLSPDVIAPVVAVVLTTWLASWIGSRRVLSVSPMQAVGASAQRSESEILRRPVRNAIGIVVFLVGTLILLFGVLKGQTSPVGLLVAVLGGMISFTGVVLSADLVIPPALRLLGHAFGPSASARLAAQNAVRYPERSARTAVGLVIGVTLVTMFAVALQTYSVFVDSARAADPQEFQGTEQLLSAISIIFGAISGFSAVIAAVGMINNLNLSVVQRIRELGLLRALGFTGGQVRRMVVAESAQLTLAAVTAGLVLGTLYGWAGAEALMGSNRLSGGIIWPSFPPVLIAVIVVAAGLLTWLASITPSRRATRVTPVDALMIE